MSFLTVVLLMVWIQQSLTQECPPLPTVPPKPVIPPRSILEKQLGASGVLSGSWRNGTLIISFRRFNFQQEEFKKPVPKTVKRKEYRQMTKKEMKLFLEALNKFHSTSQFNLFVNEHEDSRSPNAHFGVSFPGWHRHYLYILEESLRKLDPKYKEVYIPYWDSSLDHELPSPEDSAVWTKYHWGTGDGEVKDGKLCKNWQVNGACQPMGVIVLRGIMDDPDFIYSRERINSLLAAPSFTSMMINQPSLSTSQFESDHGLVHCFVGGCAGGTPGHLASLQCSPNDPIFYMLHSFVDYLWYEWTKMPNKTNTYPVPGHDGATVTNMGGPGQLAGEPMRPFPGMTNADGHKENFYSEYYERPSLIQCSVDSQCRSPTRMLFCHKCRCMAKVRKGGDCSGLPDNACYCHRKKHTPKCKRNKCRCLKLKK